MSRIRIVAKAPPPGPKLKIGGQCVFNGVMLGWTDVEVYIVHDDGTQEPFPFVRGVKLDWKEGPEALMATIEVYNPEVDVVAECDEAVTP